MENTDKKDVKINKVFGEILKRERAKTGKSQEKLALDAGINRTYVLRLEQGMMQPTITTFIKLANGLGIPAADLMRETEEAFIKSNLHLKQ